MERRSRCALQGALLPSGGVLRAADTWLRCRGPDLPPGTSFLAPGKSVEGPELCLVGVLRDHHGALGAVVTCWCPEHTAAPAPVQTQRKPDHWTLGLHKCHVAHGIFPRWESGPRSRCWLGRCPIFGTATPGDSDREAPAVRLLLGC